MTRLRPLTMNLQRTISRAGDDGKELKLFASIQHGYLWIGNRVGGPCILVIRGPKQLRKFARMILRGTKP